MREVAVIAGGEPEGAHHEERQRGERHGAPAGKKSATTPACTASRGQQTRRSKRSSDWDAVASAWLGFSRPCSRITRRRVPESRLERGIMSPRPRGLDSGRGRMRVQAGLLRLFVAGFGVAEAHAGGVGPAAGLDCIACRADAGALLRYSEAEWEQLRAGEVITSESARRERTRTHGAARSQPRACSGPRPPLLATARCVRYRAKVDTGRPLPGPMERLLTRSSLPRVVRSVREEVRAATFRPVNRLGASRALAADSNSPCRSLDPSTLRSPTALGRAARVLEGARGRAAPEVLAHRIVGTVLFTAAAQRPAAAARAARALRSPRERRALFASGVLIAINWGVFIWAVGAGRILETSLGYYMNPLVNVLLGSVPARAPHARAGDRGGARGGRGRGDAGKPGRLPWIALRWRLVRALWAAAQADARAPDRGARDRDGSWRRSPSRTSRSGPSRPAERCSAGRRSPEPC